MNRAMLDGMRAGNNLTKIKRRDHTFDTSIKSSISIEGQGLVDVMKGILRRFGLSSKGPSEMSIIVGGGKGSFMRVVLRNDYREKSTWYLNVSGNPLTFLTGENIYGWPNAELQIVKVYNRCFRIIERKTKMVIPESLKNKVRDREIFINSLEFASYTRPLKNKRHVLNAWKYMYGRAFSNEEGEDFKSLDRLLGVRATHQEYDGSFGVSVVADGTNSEVMFQAYDKEAELVNRGYCIKEEGPSSVNAEARHIPDDIRDRLRLELGLQSRWFSKRRIRTLADLVKYIGTQYQGKWKRFIRAEMEIVVHKACLVSMFEFDADPVIRAFTEGEELPADMRHLPKEAWLAMLEARLEYKMSNKDKLKKILGDQSYLQDYKSGMFSINRSVVRSLGVDVTKVTVEDC